MATLSAAEWRAKYNADQLKELGAKGHAFKNPDGSFSYPIGDVDDLDAAIHAVGRGNADHDAIRKYIIGRAADLGASDHIPDDWNSDGSIKEAKSAPTLGRKKRRHRSGPPLGREFRRFAAEGLEVRTAQDGSDQIEITGMPIVYNTPYVVRDMFGEFEETMLPGVASDVLARGADVRFLFNHDGMPLARTTSGTLTLDGSSTRGLPMTARVDARSYQANDLAIAIERGDVNQMSCGFCVARDDWADDEHRAISLFDDLFDVSAVTYPASPTTSIELAYRSLFAQPVETQARVRRLWVTVGKDLRAGKVLSQENATHLQNALSALSTVLSNANVDLSDIPGPSDDDGTEDGDQGTGTDETQDGTMRAAEKWSIAEMVEDMKAGSARAKPSTADERRAAVLSFGDTERALYTALQTAFGGDDGDECFDLWIEDAGTDWVVWCAYGDAGPGIGTWRMAYSVDADGTVTLTGEPVKVTIETNYVPVAEQPAAQRSAVLAALELEAEQLRLRGKRRRAS